MELHFQFRAKELRHLKPNWYQGSVWQAAPEQRRGFVSVPVMIAAADLNSFLAFTTDHRATADLKIYGQVLYDIGINYTFVRVIGTSTFVDSGGLHAIASIAASTNGHGPLVLEGASAMVLRVFEITNLAHHPNIEIR